MSTTTTDGPNTAGLSTLQVEILVRLWVFTVRGNTCPWGFGVRFTDAFPEERTRSESASLSRALRRLEGRGLVRRRNRHTGDAYMEDPWWRREQYRITHLALTPSGLTVAEGLATAQGWKVQDTPDG